MEKIYSPNAPKPIGPYSQAIIGGNLMFLSGQIGIDYLGNMSDGVELQTIQICENIGEILKIKGLGYKNILKTTIFLKNINDFQKVNEIYGKYFSHNPARSTVEVSNLPKGALLEIESIAIIE